MLPQKDRCMQRPGGFNHPLPILSTGRLGVSRGGGLEGGWSRQDEGSMQQLTGHSLRGQTSPRDGREPS